MTVMSWVLFRASTRLACMTAWTSVDRTGLLLAAVATGSSVMPVKEPSPSAGTWAQPAPKGSSPAGAALLLLDAMLSSAELLAAELLLVSEDAELSEEPLSEEPQALRVTARVEAVASMTPRVRVFFTRCSLWVVVRGGRSLPARRGLGRGVCGRGPRRVWRGPGGRPAGAGRNRYVAITRMDCRPLAPAGKGAARSSVCTSPSAAVARTVSW
jgi:hypothetical protein